MTASFKCTHSGGSAQSHPKPDGIPKLLLWQPGDSTIFLNTPLKDELLAEAAITIQRWFRGTGCRELETFDGEHLTSSEECSATGSDSGYDHDGNSIEAVSIRRAFFASIASANPGRSATDVVDPWTQEEIILWTSNTLNGIMDKDDRMASIKGLWREWEKANSHFLHHLRTRIVKTIDEGMHEQGFPSLRELLEVI